MGSIIAAELAASVFEQHKLTCSVGVSYNKLLSKVFCLLNVVELESFFNRWEDLGKNLPDTRLFQRLEFYFFSQMIPV